MRRSRERACALGNPVMRVIAGAHGGRTLYAPPGRGTRPTSDRVREALFSILGSIGGADVLDLFAGSGALGIEALSRGAATATFVDSARGAREAVQRNLDALGITAEVAAGDALAFCRRASQAARHYDLVFLDPPYRDAGELGPQLTTALMPLLADGARVVAESDRRHPLELGLPAPDTRRYGDTLITIHAPHRPNRPLPGDL